MTGPQTAAADWLHQTKYRERGEDFREAMQRVAFGLQDDNKHYHEFREILLGMRFLPGGRVQSAIGSTREVSAYNCMVSGTIADSYVHDPGCIMDRAKEAAATMRMGCGIGYDFSPLRPRGEVIHKLGSHSSGPVSFMRIFNEVCHCTASAGHRRGAQMGVLRVDHPDIEEFVKAKQNEHEFRGFNLSVAVTDEFMEAMLAGRPFWLQWNGRLYREIDAAALWESIMRSTWDWGEPGVIFIDEINRMNNLAYCETIAATNPCSEQPLPPYGACLLGSFNLVKYLSRDMFVAIELDKAGWSFDFDQLAHDIPIVVRAMDNVVDRTRYPLPQQKIEAQSKRRMGLGITGLANAAEAQGYRYGSQAFLDFEARVLTAIRDGCYAASMQLAKEKGPFPAFREKAYDNGAFIKSLPIDLLDRLRAHGIRNSHLTSVAPTGTISLCADNVSSGLEPVVAYSQKRPVGTPDGPVEHEVEDYGNAVLGVKGKLASEVSATEHIRVLATAQTYVDAAVSKTVNMDSSMPWDDFKQLYVEAWKQRCKSCSTFNTTGLRMALLRANEDGEMACVVDAAGRRECA